MIRVTVELLPKGDPSRARLLGTATITNDCTGDAERGNYRVELARGPECSGRPGVWRQGRVEGFPRRGRLGPWDLLLRALQDALRGRPQA